MKRNQKPTITITMRQKIIYFAFEILQSCSIEYVEWTTMHVNVIIGIMLLILTTESTPAISILHNFIVIPFFNETKIWHNEMCLCKQMHCV